MESRKRAGLNGSPKSAAKDASSSEAKTPLIANESPKSEFSEAGNICLLLFLYILQGIPLGLSASIPMILQNRNVSYKDQATFSLALWPFSVKLLWAPLVDSCFCASMGRRKSWLVPAQYLIGMFMFILSHSLDSLLGEDSGGLPIPDAPAPNVMLLTFIFFMLNFLAATQDIAVDGWALTILSREKVGYASTCNSVGQTAGFFLGYVVFLALQSRDFCVNYLGQGGPLLQLDSYFYFWSIVFMVTTTLVWIFKREDEQDTSTEAELGLKDTYKMLVTILRKNSIIRTVIVLLTCKVAFAATDSLTVLKLTEADVPMDKLALLSIPLTPVQVFLPLLISRYTAGPKPMEVFIKAFPYRLAFGLVFAVVVYFTPSFKDDAGVYHSHYYILLMVVYVLHQVTTNCMFVSVMAFFARISDPSVGGTYMTLLNTFSNLGGNWPTWVALRFVSDFTWTRCSGGEDGLKSCTVLVDGYYIETAVCLVLGLLWYTWGARTIRGLEDLHDNSWLVTNETSKGGSRSGTGGTETKKKT